MKGACQCAILLSRVLGSRHDCKRADHMFVQFQEAQYGFGFSFRVVKVD